MDISEISYIPKIGEKIMFGRICFVYKDCRSFGYTNNAWICFFEDCYYGPCVSREEVYEMVRMIKELNT